MCAPVLPGLIRESVRKAGKHHLTGKPTELMRCGSARQADTCLIRLRGAEPTLVAAVLEGYRWTGVEMTEHYAKVTNSRVSQL